MANIRIAKMSFYWNFFSLERHRAHGVWVQEEGAPSLSFGCFSGKAEERSDQRSDGAQRGDDRRLHHRRRSSVELDQTFWCETGFRWVVFLYMKACVTWLIDDLLMSTKWKTIHTSLRYFMLYIHQHFHVTNLFRKMLKDERGKRRNANYCTCKVVLYD